MSNLLKIAIGLCCALALTVSAAEGKKGEKKALTDEQKAVMKEMVGKYDENKNGKLDKEERAKMSADDKAKMAKAFPAPKKKKE